MNTNPDETALALWLDDELSGDEFLAVESWARQHPDQIAAREDVRRWRETVASVIPASEEPPYPDFFNSRVLQGIREQKLQPAATSGSSFSWRSWLLPMVACGGMVMAFWIGKSSSNAPEYDVANAPRAIPIEPVVYTPENGVRAEWFSSAKASATVIVLDGVTAIPDAMDFSETVYLPLDGESDRTAGNQSQPLLEVGP